MLVLCGYIFFLSAVCTDQKILDTTLGHAEWYG